MPGAPWHHWVRIVSLRSSSPSAAGGQFASPSSRTRVLLEHLRDPHLDRLDEPAALGEHAHDAREAVRRAERLDPPPVELLDPERVLVPVRPEPLGAVVPRLGEPRVAGAREHRRRGEHRPRRAPHQLVRRVVVVRPDQREQRLDERVVGGRAGARRARSRSRPSRGSATATRVWGSASAGLPQSGLRPVALERAQDRGVEVEQHLGVARRRQRPEAPDHPGRADVERRRLGRKRLRVVERVQRPEARPAPAPVTASSTMSAIPSRARTSSQSSSVSGSCAAGSKSATTRRPRAGRPGSPSASRARSRAAGSPACPRRSA